jgi:hypothetical protein
MAPYTLLFSADRNLEIVVPNIFDFTYLYKYAPPAIVSRIHYCAWREDDHMLKLLAKLQQAVRPDMQVSVYRDFITRNRRFLVYGTFFMDAAYESRFTDLGGIIKRVQIRGDQVLYEIDLP